MTDRPAAGTPRLAGAMLAAVEAGPGQDLARRGLTSNAVSPGLVHTPGTEELLRAWGPNPTI